MKVHYLEQHRADLPDKIDWLSARETAVLEGLRFPKRQADWLLGRWTVKTALQHYPGLPRRPMPAWEVLAGSDGAPLAYLDRDQLPLSLSLSHSAKTAFCVLCDPGARLGCDLEKIEQRSRSFEETWFTSGEIGMLGDSAGIERAERVTLIWSAKESVLKAIREGLRADTRRVNVFSIEDRSSDEWARIRARDEIGGAVYSGWWKSDDGMAFTLLSDHETPLPVLLGPAGGF